MQQAFRDEIQPKHYQVQIKGNTNNIILCKILILHINLDKERKKKYIIEK